VASFTPEQPVYNWDGRRPRRRRDRRPRPPGRARGRRRPPRPGLLPRRDRGRPRPRTPRLLHHRPLRPVPPRPRLPPHARADRRRAKAPRTAPRRRRLSATGAFRAWAPRGWLAWLRRRPFRPSAPEANGSQGSWASGGGRPNGRRQTLARGSLPKGRNGSRAFFGAPGGARNPPGKPRGPGTRQRGGLGPRKEFPAFSRAFQILAREFPKPRVSGSPTEERERGNPGVPKRDELLSRRPGRPSRGPKPPRGFGGPKRPGKEICAFPGTGSGWAFPGAPNLNPFRKANRALSAEPGQTGQTGRGAPTGRKKGFRNGPLPVPLTRHSGFGFPPTPPGRKPPPETGGKAGGPPAFWLGLPENKPREPEQGGPGNFPLPFVEPFSGAVWATRGPRETAAPKEGLGISPVLAKTRPNAGKGFPRTKAQTARARGVTTAAVFVWAPGNRPNPVGRCLGVPPPTGGWAGAHPTFFVGGPPRKGHPKGVETLFRLLHDAQHVGQQRYFIINRREKSHHDVVAHKQERGAHQKYVPSKEENASPPQRGGNTTTQTRANNQQKRGQKRSHQTA